MWLLEPKHGDPQPGRIPRDKAHLVPAKRMRLAKEWLLKMLETEEVWRSRKISLIEEAPLFAVTTDASPLGVGTVLSAIDHKTQNLTPLSAIRGKVTRNVASTLGIQHGDPSGQAVLEAWTVLLAIRYWVFRLRDQKVLLKAGFDGGSGDFKETGFSHPNFELDWGRIEPNPRSLQHG